MVDLDELEVLRELDRLEAQESFLAFYMRMTGFHPPEHVKVIANHLQAVEDDLIDRLMLFAPPRHAKSLLGSILFPAWIMGRHPTTKLMSVVHTQGYARKIGRQVRNLLRHPDWPFNGGLPGELEPPAPDEDDEEDLEQLLTEEAVQVAADSRRAEQWATTAGGEYNGFGVIGGNMHGSPAEWLFTDDIVKGRKIALSPHMREEVWETYKTDLLSRLQGRSKQVCVITRWHQDDPPGRILPENYDGRSGWFKDRETGEKWYVLSLPAISEHENDPMGRAPGEWLWPERFGDKSVLPGMRKRGGWIWSSLYQQRPSPEEGLMFQRSHLENRFSLANLDVTRLQIYGASDYAVTEQGTSSDNPDWTVHQVWGVDSDRNHYWLDSWRGRTTPDRWIKEWARLVKKHHPLRWFEESGQIIKSVGPMVLQAMEDEGAYTDRVQMASTIDKASRAQPLLGLAAMGKLYLPMKEELHGDQLQALEAFERELLEFPAGTKDDTVDAASLMARGRTLAGKAPPKRASPHGDTLDDLFERHERQEARRR